ncbi:MAG: hypothetical protein IPI38_06090 [Gemmatimonadetes bacterium]|nr:hypothetical protein [Gemmatimonadota bacterium]
MRGLARGAQVGGGGLEAAEQGEAAFAGVAVAAAQQRLEGAVEVAEPEARVVDVGALPLEPRNGDPHLVEEGGAVDLLLRILDLDLLRRRRDGLEGHQVLPHPVQGVVGQAVVVRGDPLAAGGGGVEVPAKVEVALEEVGGGAHGWA